MRPSSPVRHLALLSGMIFLAGCGSGTQTAERQPPPVTVAKPEVRTINRYAVFTGMSRAVEMAEVVARVPGRLESVDFEPGRQVEKGERLFTIEREAYAAARDAAAASLKSAQAELLRAETELSRVERASADNAVSEMDLDTARAARDKADAAVLSAEANLADAELRLSYTRVVSPIAGVVGRNLVDAGNLVGQAGPTLLTTVNKLQPMFVYFNAPEQLVLEYLAYRRQIEGDHAEFERAGGASAFVELANEDGYPHEGYVDFVDNTVDPNTGTIEMRVRLENEDLQVFPGLFVRVKVIGGEIPDAVLVPETAIGSDLGGKFVYVVGEGNIVERRFVTVGLTQDDGTIQVVDGLSGDETIIVDGLLFARPGLPVTPLTAEQFQQMLRQRAGQG